MYKVSRSVLIKRIYKNRFELFLITQVSILFGSLFFPNIFFKDTLQPLLFLLNILAGILLISKNKRALWFFILLFVVSAILFGRNMGSRSADKDTVILRLFVYFLFHFIVAWNIVQQVWKATFVNKNVIIGMMSGYISIGFLAFFMFMSIELICPGSFQGASLNSEHLELRADAIMYYAYITLLTIGYGEIVPVSSMAQKAAVLVGLIGQFYMVIITAVVVGKYIIKIPEE